MSALHSLVLRMTSSKLTSLTWRVRVLSLEAGLVELLLGLALQLFLEFASSTPTRQSRREHLRPAREVLQPASSSASRVRQTRQGVWALPALLSRLPLRQACQSRVSG